MPISEDAAFAALVQASHDEIEQYKKWLSLGTAGSLPFFSAANAVQWVKPAKFAEYLGSLSSTPVSGSPSPNVPSTKRARVPIPSSAEVLEIESDEEEPPKRIKLEPGTSAAPAALPSTPAPALASARSQEPSLTIHSVSQQFPHTQDGKIYVTRKEKVDEVVRLNHVQERWPVSAAGVDTAYIVDLTGDDSDAENVKTKLDKIIKGEDHDSWATVSNGSTQQNTKVQVLGNIPTKRSVHSCSGAITCQYFHHAALDNYERHDANDLSTTKELFSAELEQNALDSRTSLARTAS
ncbi:hypothetical protein C8J56DRAFT_1048990 [Mycena floridula]|nr:hypothetical protein C8J56DRAFT_1048990 [Mycena floridula]